MLEARESTFLPPRTLAARESMQAFFQDWIENNQLAEAFHRQKINTTHELTQFLQEYSVILTETKNIKKQEWLERSINKLEELEKLQLKLRFVSGEEEAMIFLPEIGRHKQIRIDITDILRKGFTNARAFLNILNLSEVVVADGFHGRLEIQLQIFKNQIYTAHQLQKNSHKKLHTAKATKEAITAYDILLNKLAELLIQAKVYQRIKDAEKGIVYMAEFLWSKNYERPSIHIQSASQNHANIIVFEPRFVKGSGNKEAPWAKKLARKHPWIKNLPWQVLQRPRPLTHRDGEGLKIEKATLISIKKLASILDNHKIQLESKEVAVYGVDCIPIGELGGIPVPFAMDDLTERYRITLLNQKGIYLGSQTHDDKPPFTKLEEVIFTQVEVLAPIITKERRQQGITIPLLDINLTQKIFPYKEGGLSWLQDRADANREIRKILARYEIYYEDHHNKYAYLDKKLTNLTLLRQKLAAENYIRIYVEFHDPTIIYDSIRTFPCKTNEDVEGLKAGLKIAVERLEMLKERLFELVVDFKIYYQSIQDLTLVQIFLQSRSVGSFQPQKIPLAVIEATRRLSSKLRRTECPLKNNPNSNRRIQVELLKILQASLIVKSESFETVSGWISRQIDNYFVSPLLIAPANKCFRGALATPIWSSKAMLSLLCVLYSPIFVTGWAVRLAMVAGSTLLKLPSKLAYGVRKLFGKSQNRSGRLAAAVGILFSAMGKKKLNCKNTHDHALSVLLISGNMINRAIHGELIDGKTPLMTDSSERAQEKVLAGKAMKYQQALKATGLQIR